MSCSNSDTTILSENETIIGKWKLTESSISIGGPQIKTPVENGAEFIFIDNENFSSTLFSECNKGKYAIDNNLNELILKYDCETFTSIAQNKNREIIYFYSMKSNYFILSPKSNPICIEGCSYKYERQ